ncbi:MAG: hypothetical protein EBZ36_09270 [Acidobacteria bacterium]|nr:hypothetical protein [Acidobacteriota bacterium]
MPSSGRRVRSGCYSDGVCPFPRFLSEAVLIFMLNTVVVSVERVLVPDKRQGVPVHTDLFGFFNFPKTTFGRTDVMVGGECYDSPANVVRPLPWPREEPTASLVVLDRAEGLPHGKPNATSFLIRAHQGIPEGFERDALVHPVRIAVVHQVAVLPVQVADLAFVPASGQGVLGVSHQVGSRQLAQLDLQLADNRALKNESAQDGMSLGAVAHTIGV